MQPSQPLAPHVAASPWQEKQLSYGAKLGLTLVSALLLVILLVSLFVVIGVSGDLIRGGDTPQTVRSNLIAVGVAALLLVASLVGLIVIWPRTRSTTRFTPAYGAIPATT